jgi:VWFA-related protein
MRTSMVLAVVLAATLSAFAQSLTEKIDVSLVNVDVSVSSHGQPARGLAREEFQVFEDGVAQPITNFYEVAPAPTTGTRAQAAPETAALADPADERFRRRVLVIIDDRHVSMPNRDRALAALEHFVDDRFTGGTYDWSIAVISDRAHLLLPLTSDKSKLHEALITIRRIATNPEHPAAEDVTRLAAMKDTDPNDWSKIGTTSGSTLTTLDTVMSLGVRTQMDADAARTVGAIRDAIGSFAGIPGRKIILLVTGGLGFDDGLSPLDTNPRSPLSGPAAIAGAMRSATILRDLLIHDANTSNVSVYIVNSEGLASSSDATNGNNDVGFASSIGRTMPAGASTQLASMYWLARETGGRLMPGNSAERSLADFDRDSSSFYSLAYKPAHGDDGKYHTIKVQLRHSGYQLQYRTGYSTLTANLQLARAMQSPSAHPWSTPRFRSTSSPAAARHSRAASSFR